MAAKRIVKRKAVETIASVPDEHYADEYISRSFHGLTEFDIFASATALRRNILIEGPTGPGKTSAVMAYSAAYGKRFYAVPSNIGVEPSQLFGKYIPNPNSGENTFVWQDGPVTDIVRYGGVLLINEVNFLPERIATVLFSLFDKRREIVLLDHKGEVVRAHFGVECWCGAEDCSDKMILVVADMNPEYEGTRPLNKAFRNRFAIQLWWDYDNEVEEQLVDSTSLLEMARQLRTEVERGGLETPVATNMLMEFEELCGEFGFRFAAMNFVNHFTVDERPSVSQLVETWSANIMSELCSEEQDSESDEESDEDGDLVDWVYSD